MTDKPGDNAEDKEAAARYETDTYEYVRALGQGNFGVACLMRHKGTGDMVAVKFLERGPKIDKNVQREIVNHRLLRHPNIIGFREVFLTDQFLGIVMEDANSGELFDRVADEGRFSEDTARYFFRQLIAGVDFMHKSGVCHRDLKLENTLLHGDKDKPQLKICDFGYSKSENESVPKTTVGTPAYIAPELLQKKGNSPYDGQLADVWSCGVALYVMLVGTYPFEDPSDPMNIRKTLGRIQSVKYSFPADLKISRECVGLFQRIFVADAEKRITIAEIQKNPWYLKNTDKDYAGEAPRPVTPEPVQSIEELQRIVKDAQVKLHSALSLTSEILDNEDMTK